MTLKNRLKRYRFENNQVTQAQLAKSLEVSRQTIIAIENGKFNPSVKLALNMSAFFKCRVEDLFYLTEDEI